MNENQTYKIIYCAMEVHNYLGNGYKENVYKNALLIELRHAGFDAEKEKDIDVWYKGNNVGRYSADILVNDKIILEIKCAKEITFPHIDQLQNYLFTTRLPFGYVFNFRPSMLEFRKVYSKATILEKTINEMFA